MMEFRIRRKLCIPKELVLPLIDFLIRRASNAFVLIGVPFLRFTNLFEHEAWLFWEEHSQFFFRKIWMKCYNRIIRLIRIDDKVPALLLDRLKKTSLRRAERIVF